MRHMNRPLNAMRSISFTRSFTRYAEGSVLVECGNTKVLCTASVQNNVPPFLKDSGQGWITAEYGMLPRSTHERMPREAAKGKQSGRTQEIQRLIGRSLRTAVDLKALGERTITLDCDVIQADGGTRTAAINGACLAVYDALKKMDMLSAFREWIGAVSVGIIKNEPHLDLDYEEDKHAETDMNVVMTESGQFIEIQGTAEQHPFSREEFNRMLEFAEKGIREIILKQKV